MLLTQKTLQRLWLKALLLVLFGYAVLGKGFAYLFIGEMVLFIGTLVFLLSRRLSLIFSDSVLLLWLAFSLWGLYRTVPYLSRYRFDALRDSVIWGYGAVALLIVAFVNDSRGIYDALNGYRKFVRWYLLIVPLIVISSIALRDEIPTIPWSDGVNIVLLKAGDAGVLLAGAGLFLMLFPKRRLGQEAQAISIYNVFAFVGFVSTAVVIVMVTRGGFVALMVPVVLIALFKAKSIGWKIAGLGVVAVVLGLLVIEANPFTLHVKGRTFAASETVSLLGSIAGSSDSAQGHRGTKQWRLSWWRKIVHYTFSGPYFWKGKGFGVNLAKDDRPWGVTTGDIALRSPHNGSMTVLARMGVPGLAIWLALNTVFVVRLFGGYRLASKDGSHFWSNLNLWLFCFWLSAFIEMSFDVYLEGPQGGIWFWSIIGFGVAVSRVQRHETRQKLRKSPAEVAEVLQPEYAVMHS